MRVLAKYQASLRRDNHASQTGEAVRQRPTEKRPVRISFHKKALTLICARGEDLAPTKYSLVDEPIPKSLARVLNATKIREEWKGRKRKLEEVGGNAHAGKRRKAGDDAERSTEKKQKSKLAIKPGESIQHFNRFVYLYFGDHPTENNMQKGRG